MGLALYVALAIGEAPVLGSTVCAQECADDDADGHCAPTCSDCACCAHIRVMTVPVAMRAIVPATAARLPQRTVDAPPIPEPREILHVPIA